MNYEEFLTLNITVRNCDIMRQLEKRNIKNNPIILNDTITHSKKTPKSPKPENYLIHDADEHQENTIIEPFFNSPEIAVKTALSLKEEVKVRNDKEDGDDYVLDELWKHTANYSMAFCMIDENQKTIQIYRNKSEENITEYAVLILLKKNENYTYYYYKKHNMYKVQKVWDYKRIVVQLEHMKGYTKKSLQEKAKENDIYTGHIKSAMKKQEIYVKMCEINFEFY